MRYLLRENFFSFTDDFTITDENGNVHFKVVGRFFSIGKKMHFEDSEGNVLAEIRQKLISFTPTYEIYRDGQLFARVEKHLFTLFSARFSVDVPGPDDLEAAGDFLDHEYVFTRHGETVAEVSKRWFALTDTYAVDVRDGEDDVLLLAATIVIDAVSHPDNN